MKRTSTLTFAFIGVLFFTSCKREESINIDQNRIYTNYSFTFDENKNESTMTATFRLDNSGGKKLELSYPSRVDFNGEGLAWRKAMGYYSMSRSGEEQTGIFNYHDLDDNTFSNNIPSLNSIELPFGMNSINQNGNFFLPWFGGAIQSGESVRVTIRGGDQTGSQTWTISTPGSMHIMLDENRLRNLVPGNAEIQLEREISKSLNNTNLSGGRITSKYLSRKYHIQITN